MTDTLRLRITVEHPPTGVAMQVQRGRDGLLPAARVTPDSLSFEFDVRLGAAMSGRGLRLLGEFTQGPVDTRFVYVNSGTCAGQYGSCWTRRAKVPLRDITLQQAQAVLADERLLLEARIAGTARDGGPMCASVPLLGEGWKVTAAR